MEKKIWKQWDESLIEGWKSNGSTYGCVIRFLLKNGFTEEQLKSSGPALLFAEIGVNSRSPKNGGQMHYRVRAFFYTFFPSANDFLWQGDISAATQALRKYKVDEKGLPSKLDRETEKIKREQKRKSSSGIPGLIPGTNAISIRHARRSVSDWNTVKPPNRQKRMR